MTGDDGSFLRPKFKEKEQIFEIMDIAYYPTEPSTVLFDVDKPDGTWEEVKVDFLRPIMIVGEMDLNENYYCILLRIETTTKVMYDLWSLSLEGKPISQLCLFIGSKKSVLDSTIEWTEITSEITQDNKIKWHRELRGSHTYATWQLTEDGYFEVLEKKQAGEFDY